MANLGPHRRSIRLPDFDYRQPGAYFVTICTHGRGCNLGQIVEGEVELGPLGEIVDACWRQIASHFPHVELYLHVVMPDHIHGIMIILRRGTPSVEGRGTPWRAPTEAFGRPVKGSLPTVIRAFKSSATRIARGAGLEGRLFQRGYYERVLRSEEELARVQQYIRLNPEAWGLGQDEEPSR